MFGGLLEKFMLATFIVVVIYIGIFTIKLKRRNRERMHKTLEQLLKTAEPPEPQAPAPAPKPSPPPKPPKPPAPHYIPPKEQDLDLAVVPFGEEFSEAMELLVYLGKTYPDEVRLRLYEPVSESELLDFEEKHHIRFTQELRALYRFTDGFSLIWGHMEIDPLRMVRRNLANKYEWGDTKHYVWIGSLIGDGEMILYDPDTQHIVTNDHGEETEYETLTELIDYVIELFEEIDDDRLQRYLNQ